MRDPRASEQIRSFCAWESAAMILCVHKQRSSRVEVPRESSEAKWAYLGRIDGAAHDIPLTTSQDRNCIARRAWAITVAVR